MTRLLRSDFRRMMKNKIFYLCVFAMLLLALTGVLSRFYYANVVKEPGYDNTKGLFFLDMMCFAVLVAVLDGMFIGTEYQDKTIRNKLIIGHNKVKVYLSYFIVTSVALLLLHLVYASLALGLSATLLDGFQTPGQDYFGFLLCSFTTIIALNAVMIMLCMFIQNKAYGSVLCILLALGLILAGIDIQGSLENPKTIGGYEYEYEGEIVKVPERDNPYYVGGAMRSIYEFLDNFLPGGHAITIAQKNELPSRFWTMPIYDAAFVLLTTFVGIWGFKRRNMK